MTRKYRREYDKKLVGRKLKRLREKQSLSVEEVRQYLMLGSVQAIYKYEAGYNYPQADVLLALLELYEADYRELICEQITDVHFPEDGCWVLFLPTATQTERLLPLMIRQLPRTVGRSRAEG